MDPKSLKLSPSEFNYMKIKILGTRGKIEPSARGYKNHSGILIDGKILIDVGESEYMEHDLEAVVFTHFHPDHAYFVSQQEKFSSEIALFGPEAQEFVPNLTVVSEKFNIGEYQFTPVPVIHALKLKSLGYVIQKGEKSIFITGDVAWIEKAEREQLPKVDLVITEATFINKGGRINRKKDRIFGHTGVPDLIRILSPMAGKIVFTHYGNWFFENVEDGLKKIKVLEEDVPLIPAKDGMEIEI